jgi:hypothetical protein
MRRPSEDQILVERHQGPSEVQQPVSGHARGQ